MVAHRLGLGDQMPKSETQISKTLFLDELTQSEKAIFGAQGRILTLVRGPIVSYDDLHCIPRMVIVAQSLTFISLASARRSS